MAGSGDADDNPVGLNVVPMVDILFCLCVFFLCSFKSKALEGRFESWLPADKGDRSGLSQSPIEIRLVLFWDEAHQRTVRQYVTRMIASDEELEAVLAGAHADAVRSGHAAPLLLDADGRVPWSEVVAVVNLCKRLGIESIDFGLGTRPLSMR